MNFSFKSFLFQIWYVYHPDDHVYIVKILQQDVISNEWYDAVAN